MRNVRIYANRPGFLLEGVNVYYTSQSAEYLLAEDLSYDDWSDGFVARIPDETTTIIAVCMTGSCAGQSSSQAIPPKVENVRFLHGIVSGSGGQVSFAYPSVVAAANAVTLSVDYRDYSAARILAHPNASHSLVGWYTASNDTNTIATSNPLSITRTYFPLSDKFYAKFSDFNLSATTSSIGANSSMTFNLQTKNFADGTTFDYTASGLNNEFLSSGSLTGSFVLTNNSGSTTITLAEVTASNTSEFVFVLNNTSASAVTTRVISQSYILSGAANVHEGMNARFEVYTTGHKNGDRVDFRVLNLSGSDFISGSVSGSFVIHDQTGSYVFDLAEDADSGDEVMTLYIDAYPHISHSTNVIAT